MDKYINAEVMAKRLKEWDTSDDMDKALYEFAMRRLIEQPAADVMEVKYGRWVYDPDGMDWNIGAWRCSECGCKNGNLGSYSSTNPYHCAGSKFCGNCGAKMTGNIKSTEICLSTGLKCSKCTPGPCSSRKQV